MVENLCGDDAGSLGLRTNTPTHATHPLLHLHYSASNYCLFLVLSKFPSLFVHIVHIFAFCIVLISEHFSRPGSKVDRWPFEMQLACACSDFLMRGKCVGAVMWSWLLWLQAPHIDQKMNMKREHRVSPMDYSCAFAVKRRWHSWNWRLLQAPFSLTKSRWNWM